MRSTGNPLPVNFGLNIEYNIVRIFFFFPLYPSFPITQRNWQFSFTLQKACAPYRHEKKRKEGNVPVWSGENVIDYNIVSVSSHYFISEINVPFQVNFQIQTWNYDLVNIIQRMRLFFVCIFYLYFSRTPPGLGGFHRGFFALSFWNV